MDNVCEFVETVPSDSVKTTASSTGAYGYSGVILGYPVKFVEQKKLEPEKIIYNDRTTIVFWNDGTRTQSTASLNEIADPEVGFAMCLLKKLYGKKVYGKPLYRRMINRADVQGNGADDMMAEYRFSLNLKRQQNERRNKKRGKRK